jgi:hypothetical protein
MLVAPNMADRKDLAKYLVTMPEDYDPERQTCRIRGDAILHLAAPAGMKIAWFTIGATFRTYQGEEAGKTNNRIAYAVGRPEQFREIYKSSIPTWVNHWRYNWDTDVVLDKPADEVYVKFTGDPGLNVVRACLHLLPTGLLQTGIRIVHGYRIDGQLNRKRIDLDEPGCYVVQCDSEPENVFIEMGVPSK